MDQVPSTPGERGKGQIPPMHDSGISTKDLLLEHRRDTKQEFDRLAGKLDRMWVEMHNTNLALSEHQRKPHDGAVSRPELWGYFIAIAAIAVGAFQIF